MRPTVRWMLISAAFLGLGALLIWAFLARRAGIGDEEKSDQPIRNPTLVTRSASGENVVRINRETQDRIGLKTVGLAVASLQPEIVAYGRLEEDPSRTFVVRAPLAGTVQKTSGRDWPTVGQSLADGAVAGMVEPRIATVDRVNLTDRLASARADLDAISASRAAARAAYERARALNADNKNVSDRAVEEAEARLKTEEARFTSASQTVRLFESSLKSASGPAGALPLQVERGGQVVEVLAQPGESVESGTPILRVSRFDHLLARVDVPAGESVGAGVSKARVIAMGREDRPFPAERVALGAFIDPKTQGQPFLFRVSASDLALRPGQAVTAYLELPGAPRHGVIVPRAALVRYAGKAWVYLQAAPGQLARREVALEEITAGGWFTRSLAPGDRIVVEGAQTLLSEELKSQISVGEENPE